MLNMVTSKYLAGWKEYVKSLQLFTLSVIYFFYCFRNSEMYDANQESAQIIHYQTIEPTHISKRPRLGDYRPDLAQPLKIDTSGEGEVKKVCVCLFSYFSYHSFCYWCILFNYIFLLFYIGYRCLSNDGRSFL